MRVEVMATIMNEEVLKDCSTAEEVLMKLKAFGVSIESVTNVLANDVFMSNMMATCNGRTLLHMAAQANNVEIVSAVVQAYKTSGLLTKALITTAVKDTDKEQPEGSGTLPLHTAIISSNYENTVLLMKEYEKHCPETVKALMYGSTLMHLAAYGLDKVPIIKYFLREHKDICIPMLLVKNNGGETPVQVAGGYKFHAENAYINAKRFAETSTKNLGAKGNPSMREMIIETHMSTPRRKLEQAKDMVNLLYEPTMQARTAEAERQAILKREQLLCEKEVAITAEVHELLNDKKLDDVLANYIMSSDEHTQKISLNILASTVGSSSEISVSLPSLTVELLKVIKKYLEGHRDDVSLKSSLKLLVEWSNDNKSRDILLSDSEGVLTLILKLLRNLDTDIQYLSVSILFHISANIEGDRLSEEWKQPLLLVKNFSLSEKVKKLASNIIERMGASKEVPNPGSWQTEDVCFWMEGNSGIERKSEFARAFRDAEINGLHLLELTPTEMAGLGVKFVSDQRNLSSLIDDLRRLNMRSVTGRKDVFLSYAHINIQFALNIKRVLNDGGYTVWIDTAGIRAGQKWRTEIAHGIHDCRLLVFIMTPRSTNSQYCHDELSLAEEYKKPIITVRYQHAEEMDPGLKLTIQRRQWIDFSDATHYSESCTKLMEAVSTLIGVGSGPEIEEEFEEKSIEEVKQTAGGLPGGHVTADTLISAVDVQQLVAIEVERMRGDMMKIVSGLEAKVSDLSARLTVLENKR